MNKNIFNKFNDTSDELCTNPSLLLILTKASKADEFV